MSQVEYKQFYERNRPHIHPPNSVLFVTFRLAGSVPQAVLAQYKAEKNWIENEIGRIAGKKDTEESDADHLIRLKEFHRSWFGRFEKILDSAKNGPMWLGQPEIREIVSDKLTAGDRREYRLDAFSIMSNHVHAVLKPNISERNLLPISTSSKPRYVSPEQRILRSCKVSKAQQRGRQTFYLGELDHFGKQKATITLFAASWSLTESFDTR